MKTVYEEKFGFPKYEPPPPTLRDRRGPAFVEQRPPGRPTTPVGNTRPTQFVIDDRFTFTIGLMVGLALGSIATVLAVL